MCYCGSVGSCFNSDMCVCVIVVLWAHVLILVCVCVCGSVDSCFNSGVCVLWFCVCR